MSIVARFREIVDQYPDAVALVGNGVAHTYRQLAHDVQQRAATLRAAGVAAGHAVAFARPRSVDAVVLQLAILECGAAYVPLDPHGPAPRWERMLRRLAVTRPLHVVGDHEDPLATTARMCDVATIGSGAQDDRRVPALAAWSASDDLAGEQAAYVMFTSGSTGEPKGVVVPHRAVRALVEAVDYVQLGPGRVLLHAAPLAFDASTFEIWGALLTGGCCVVHDEAIPTAAGLGRAIRAHGVTTLWLTAGLFNAIIDEDPTQLAPLDELLIGGEALSVSHVRRALAALPTTTIINGYGPTETTTFAATWRIPRSLPADASSVPIGVALPRATLQVCDDVGRVVPDGEVGELYIGGDGVALGYLVEEAGVPSPFGPDPQTPSRHQHRTGDLVRRRDDGALEYVGRRDAQLKIGGHRIEPAEIERVLAGVAGVAAAAVVAVPRGEAGAVQLIAFVVPAGTQPVEVDVVRRTARAELPPPMVPADVRIVTQLPLTANGKLDRRALVAQADAVAPATMTPKVETPDLTAQLCADWSALLGTTVSADSNLFEAGATSLLVVRFVARLSARAGREIAAITCFEHPSPRRLAAALRGTVDAAPPVSSPRLSSARTPDDRRIAIVGAAVRYPGADSLEAFWQRLLGPDDTITHFTAESLDPEVSTATRNAPGYVAARGVLDGVDTFDAEFFGITPREAQLTDPQQRLWLELAWEALEDAALVAERTRLSVGVFGGVYNSTYLARALSLRPELVDAYGAFNAMLLNEKDYVAPRVAHRLGLRGPAVSVHTACSTSLVAIVQAVQALRERSCDVALAGGVALTLPVRSGYVHQEGSMLSPDGRTRPFDAQAAGTVFSDGAGVVVLKRLVDAERDGDRIIAVIAGVGINNDGAERASFSAPSVAGQVDVVRRALHDAGCTARDIAYVEAHGTATPLGDPIEFEALRRVFEADGVPAGACRLGSIKGHLGHTVIAAGVAGLLKTALALRHARLPGTANHRTPLPALHLETSPFRIPVQPEPWPPTAAPRRAGVSSFGVGGTNAHVILEEAPRVSAAAASGVTADARTLRADPLAAVPSILPLAARTPTALDAMTLRLADALDRLPDEAMPAVERTLQHGRAPFARRRAIIARTRTEAVAAGRGARPDDVVQGDAADGDAPITFLFSGQGAQRPGMTRALYAHEPVFRAAFDECAAIVQREAGFALRAAIDDGTSLEQTAVAQPALFATGWALAALWRERGVTPQRLVGHSVGEFVAATLAGILSLDDALRLVCRRGALMQAMPAGTMLAVALDEAHLRARLPESLAIAAINASSQCVVSGPSDAVEAFRATLEAEGILARPLRTSHAFHSAMMDPVLPAFGALVADVTLSPPTLPIISTVTGRLLDPVTATDRAYWTRHLRETVRFADAMATAVQLPSAVYLELGPASTLSSLARRVATTVRVVPSLDGTADEPRAMARAAAQLWCWGAARAWPDRPPPLAPLSLPSYPFERRRCWVEAPAADVDAPCVTDRAGSPPPIVSPASSSTPHAPASPMSDQPRSTDRPIRLAREVLALVEDVAGLPVRDADPAARFTALGLDSLVLTQLALAVSRRYGVKVAFRQLLEALPSAADLAAHLDGALPADPVDAPPAAEATPRALTAGAPTMGGSTVAPAVAPVAASVRPIATGVLTATATDGVAAVIAQQLQLMQQQLALLTGSAVVPATAAAPSHVAPALETTTSSHPATPAGEEASAPAAQAAATEAPDGPAVGPNRGVYDATKAFGAAMRVTVTDHGDTLSPRQRARLDAFIRRYTARTAGSKRYTATHRDGMADPRAVTGFRPLTKELVYPIVVERSRGARVWDIDGNEYIDVLSGFGSNLLGWTPDVVTEALRAQLDRGFEVGPQHVLAGEVAERFRALTGAERVAFCNTGSEAVLGAIRIARTVTGRPLVAMFSGAYHGINDEVIVRPRPDGRAMPAAPGILPEATRNALVLDWANPESLRVLESRADEIAAVLVEPVQSRRPDLQPREFLAALRELTARTGIVFIWDEIVTGFRAAPGGAQELFGVRGDLATYGKIVGGGFPIGVIAGKREFMDALDGGPWQYGDASVPEVGVTYFAGTFVRHPLALAAARAMLDELARQGPALQDTLAARTTAVAEAINAKARELGAPVQVRHFRSVWKTFLTADTPHGDLLFYALRERGLHIYDGFPCFMTAAHGEVECAAIVDAFAGAMEEMLEGRFLPRVRVEEANTEAVGSERPSATRTARPVRPAHTA